jgi:hypothetical protein
MQQAYMWHRKKNYFNFIKNIVNNKNTDRSRAEDTAVPQNFSAPDDDRVGWNM